MAERNLPDQLNELIDGLLANNPVPGGELEPLLAIAADLRNMPSPQFKARLKSDLERRTIMSAAAVVTPIPKGFHTVTPYLIAKRLFCGAIRKGSSSACLSTKSARASISVRAGPS